MKSPNRCIFREAYAWATAVAAVAAILRADKFPLLSPMKDGCGDRPRRTRRGLRGVQSVILNAGGLHWDGRDVVIVADEWPGARSGLRTLSRNTAAQNDILVWLSLQSRPIRQRYVRTARMKRAFNDRGLQLPDAFIADWQPSSECTSSLFISAES